MDSPTVLLLVPAVIGYTEAIKNQFPALKGIVPLIAVAVSFLMYYAHVHLAPELFMTIYGAGAGMGFYTGAKVLGNIKVTPQE